MDILTGIGIGILIVIGLLYVIPLLVSWGFIINFLIRDGIKQSETWAFWFILFVSLMPIFNIVLFVYFLWYKYI